MTAPQLSAEDENTNRDDDKRENARVGYESAINLWGYIEEQIWAIFNAMLVANSIIVYAITNNNSLSLYLTKPLSVVGLVVCICWFILMKRANGYQEYYVKSARELEEQYLSNPIKTVSRGGDFAEGREVGLQIDGKPIKLVMPCWGRLSSEWVSYLIILSFGIIYTYVLFYTE